MCFSATASFAAAAATGVVGVVCLARSGKRGQLPLAAMPLVFAAQQALEGALWLELASRPGSGLTHGATLAFLIIAQVLWPVYAPLAVVLVEPDAKRAALMLIILAIGFGVGASFLGDLLTGQLNATIVGGHIAYDRGRPIGPGPGLLYALASLGALALSSHTALRLLSAIIATGAAVSWAFYWQAFSSVWCYFAATASVVLLAHFQLQVRARHTSAAT